jgi:hypothetical protein
MLTIKQLLAGSLLIPALIYSDETAHSHNYPPLESFQNQPNKWDFFADVLVWSAQETCSEWAFVVPPAFAAPPAAPITGSYNAILKAVTFDWNTGLRTGVAYTIERDRWDTVFYYTWYRTSGSNHLDPPPGQVLQSQFIATDFLLTLPEFSTSFNKAKIKWDILFNMFNCDLGRIFYLGQSLSLRPHIGLQGGWIYQNIFTHWFASNTLSPYNARETIRHRFWGIGPEIGIDTKWNFWKNSQHAFSIYGDFGQAYMWGHWSFKEVAHTTANVTTINTQPDRNMGSLAFQSSAGFVWNARFNKSRSLFTFKLGYEFQLWTQQLQFFQHFSGILNNALILQGATVRFLIEF